MDDPALQKLERSFFNLNLRWIALGFAVLCLVAVVVMVLLKKRPDTSTDEHGGNSNPNVKKNTLDTSEKKQETPERKSVSSGTNGDSNSKKPGSSGDRPADALGKQGTGQDVSKQVHGAPPDPPTAIEPMNKTSEKSADSDKPDPAAPEPGKKGDGSAPTSDEDSQKK